MKLPFGIELPTIHIMWPKLSLSAIQMNWFKSESAAFMAAVSQASLMLFGYDIGWLEVVVTTVVVYIGGYVTVRN